MNKVLAGAGILVVLIAGVTGFLVYNINSVVKNGIEVVAPEVLGVPVIVGDVRISLLTGSGVISGIKVGNPEGYQADYAMEVDEVRITLEPLSIGSDQIRIKEMIIDSPSITYEGNLMESNLDQLQKNAEARVPDDAGDETGSSSVRIDHLRVNNASIGVQLSFLDRPLSLVLPGIELNDIGRNGDASAADVIHQVMVAVNRSVVPLIRENSGGLRDRLKEATDKISDRIGDKLKGLFKR